MKNNYLDARTAADIDRRIERIHKDLGYKSGFIDLSQVRELLNLSVAYYSAEDPGLLQEVVHKLSMAGKQVIKRPQRLLDAIRKFDLRALYLPERKQILIDESLPALKKRWGESHEIAHSITPWHAGFMHGDDRYTLSPTYHQQIESEANYGAGRLIFPARQFGNLALNSKADFVHIVKLSQHFGNTITTTLWQYVECRADASFGLVGAHPHFPKPDEPNVACFIRSRAFESQFSDIAEQQLYRHIQTYTKPTKAGFVGEAEIVMTDDNGDGHIFRMELFSTTYNLLTFAYRVRPASSMVQVVQSGPEIWRRDGRRPSGHKKARP